MIRRFVYPYLCLFIALISLTIPETGASQETGTSLDFLNIAPSAASLALSEASATLPNGSAAIYTNPALLSASDASSLDLTYSLWVSDITGQFGGVNIRQGAHAFAVSIYHAESDRFQPVAPNGTVFYPIQYLSLAAGAATMLGPLHLGAGVHYIREEVIEHRANGYLFSGGLMLPVAGDQFRFGLALLNMGSIQELDVTQTTPPGSLRTGFSSRLWTTELAGLEEYPLRFTLHAELHHPVRDHQSGDFTALEQEGTHYNLGLAKSLDGVFELRSGLRMGKTERPFSFGALLNVTPVRVSYAIIPFSTGYGTAHSISLNYMF